METNIQTFLNQAVRQDVKLSATKKTKNPSCAGKNEKTQETGSAGPTMGLGIASILPENSRNLLIRNDLHCRMTSNSVTYYPAQNSSFHAKKRSKKSDENLKKKSYKGTMSKETRNKLKTKLDTWVTLVQVFNMQKIRKYRRKETYITFLTLTLPQAQTTPDKEITNNCLSRFIEKLKYKYEIINYFWRAERQENGNIHYHLLLDRYIEKTELQISWNKTLKKNNLMNEYAKKFKSYNPPTTRIKALPPNNSAKNYLVKYSLKEEENGEINGRVWYCSKSISNLKPCTFTSALITRDIINYILSNFNIKTYETEFSTTILVQDSELFETEKGFPFQIQLSYMLLLYHLLYRQRHEKDKHYQYKQKVKLNSVQLNHLYKKSEKKETKQTQLFT